MSSPVEKISQQITENLNQSANSSPSQSCLSPQSTRESSHGGKDSDFEVTCAKRIRTAFDKNQISQLEAEFNRENYISKSRRLEIARKLSLEENTVKNRRMKKKREKVTPLFIPVGYPTPPNQLAMNMFLTNIFNYFNPPQADFSSIMALKRMEDTAAEETSQKNFSDGLFKPYLQDF